MKSDESRFISHRRRTHTHSNIHREEEILHGQTHTLTHTRSRTLMRHIQTTDQISKRKILPSVNCYNAKLLYETMLMSDR